MVVSDSLFFFFAAPSAESLLYPLCRVLVYFCSNTFLLIYFLDSSYEIIVTDRS